MTLIPPEVRSVFRTPSVARACFARSGLALVLVATTAGANGRFPRAQRLIQDREKPELMALYGTYGLLVSRDGGASWRHVCEAATGAYAGEDSLLELMAGGRIVLRTDTGLSRSDANLCSYDAVLGGTDDASDALQDITRDADGGDGLLALSTTLVDTGVFASKLSSSTDGGGTFAPLANIPSDVLALGLTLDVGADRPELIYVSGFDRLGRGTLAKSTDRGQSFVGFPITGLELAAPPYIAAVSVLDPDRVFVRSDEFSRPENDFEARETANDSLYFTPDGGQTWHRSLTRRGKLYGFALSPDERWVLAGYADPVVAATFVEPDDLGLYRVALDDLALSPDAPPWERIYARSVTCLRWTERALFACVAQNENGFEVGRAPDASFSLADATPFEGLLRLPEVLPLECAAGSPGAACGLDQTSGWPATCAVLRAQCSLDSAGKPSTEGQPGPGAPGAGGTTTASSAMNPESSMGMGGVSASAGGGSAVARGTSDDGSISESPSSTVDEASPRPSGSCSAVAPARGRANGGPSRPLPSRSLPSRPSPSRSLLAGPLPAMLCALLLISRRRARRAGIDRTRGWTSAQSSATHRSIVSPASGRS